MVLRYSCLYFLKTVLQPVTTSELAQLDSRAEIPWAIDFDLRYGVDALTGALKRSALKGVGDESLPNHPSPRANFTVDVIRSDRQQQRMRKFEVQGAINPMGPIALSTSFAIQTKHDSSNQSSLVEVIVFGEHDFEKLKNEDLELTSEALDLSRSPEEFRKIYGDYFIRGFQRRYWFHALVESR